MRTKETIRTAVVLGAGFAGMAAACVLAQEGVQVTVLEKNAAPGGRARAFAQDGYTFDLGPSWYWMPDVFEKFFARFGKKPSDYYELVRLDPSYRVFFANSVRVDVPAERGRLLGMFEAIEPGSADQLKAFLKEAEYKYKVGMTDYVWRPSLSIGEFADARMLRESLSIGMFQSVKNVVRKRFRDDRLRQILEFPVLFLGGTAADIPAMYTLMNYADLVLGTWYPMGGMIEIPKAIHALAESLGVTFRFNEPVTHLDVVAGRVQAARTASGVYPADIVIGAGDYQHIEQTLLDPEWRTYDDRYWESRVLSPSSLLYYVGVKKRLSGLLHHNLFFDEGLAQHAEVIYKTPGWPERPLFYACCPSQTDRSVAPDGCENLFLLVPVAPGLTDTPEIRRKYFDLILSRLERHTNQSVRDDIVVYRDYAHADFIADYNAYKGNAYGLANTLKQTAFFKPTMQPKKVRNLYFAGQLTVPGPGVPPSLISGQVAAGLALERGA